jgi:hypothetical protein
MKTLAQVAQAYDFAVLEHLEADAEVPVLDGLQAQGDLIIVPVPCADTATLGHGVLAPVPPEGVPVIEGVNGGHEHRLFASVPGTATFRSWPGRGQVIGVLECTEPAYLLHPEHGATGIAPGTYELRRQREQAAEERIVVD